MPDYRLHYVMPGLPPRTIDYSSPSPLREGQHISVAGLHLLVERVVKHKPGDKGAEKVICRRII
jgi:hypothetical protein